MTKKTTISREFNFADDQIFAFLGNLISRTTPKSAKSAKVPAKISDLKVVKVRKVSDNIDKYI